MGVVDRLTRCVGVLVDGRDKRIARVDEDVVEQVFCKASNLTGIEVTQPFE